MRHPCPAACKRRTQSREDRRSLASAVLAEGQALLSYHSLLVSNQAMSKMFILQDPRLQQIPRKVFVMLLFAHACVGTSHALETQMLNPRPTKINFMNILSMSGGHVLSLTSFQLYD